MTLDRLVWLALAVAVAVTAVAAALSALVTAAVVVTACFVIGRLVWGYTSRW